MSSNTSHTAAAALFSSPGDPSSKHSGTLCFKSSQSREPRRAQCATRARCTSSPTTETVGGSTASASRSSSSSTSSRKALKLEKRGTREGDTLGARAVMLPRGPFSTGKLKLGHNLEDRLRALYPASPTGNAPITLSHGGDHSRPSFT